MTDEMFYSNDDSAMKRGRRSAPRTETCRPCLIWESGKEDKKVESVALDLNPYGMLVRAIDLIPIGSIIYVQMMRDEEYTTSLARPIQAKVVRHEAAQGGFTDHGLQLIHEDIRREESPPVEIEGVRPRPVHKSQMHTIDITVGDKESRRGKR